MLFEKRHLSKKLPGRFERVHLSSDLDMSKAHFSFSRNCQTSQDLESMPSSLQHGSASFIWRGLFHIAVA
jgi:hypothetical protein